ncbi:N-acetylglucosamine-6-phosphate deacetylase [Anaeromicropila herbilytica]|uniref:N-acetylglucosamine-6-phosphate deacetylase n=1 Tax=Anaeromicropila herbilytica TaxID=2785025 RepID=A0A7R7EHG2_9FIRM|nr:N-acetylglucosamine-6-phosphate deacetylase [Anaeromicropila herbilytica]BCN28827.1 N-acetylglucosamine-6-phosphate deacetylase [Anaeromicropila herbilytica]
MLIKNAAVYLEDGHFHKQDITISNGTFGLDRTLITDCTLTDGHNDSSVSNWIDLDSFVSKPHDENIRWEDSILDASHLYAIPGLIDIHFHGCAGHDFSEGTYCAIEKIAEYQLRNGITNIVPATMTLSEESLFNICKSVATYTSLPLNSANLKSPFTKSFMKPPISSMDVITPIGQYLSSAQFTTSILSGINMEGPFLSHDKKGAQNEQYLKLPDIALFERLLKASNNMIKLITIAPELPHSLDFIKQFSKDVIISLGHTMADYDTAKNALNMGASHITHLYNAMPAYSHRAPGVIGAAFDSKDCTVELICDGNHLHPSVVRSTFQQFTDNRIILISDSMMATGLSDGTYSLGEQEVTVKGTLATLADGTLAGSVTNLMDCVRIAVKDIGIPLESAIKCATINPARKLGIDDRYGSIANGKVANLILLDRNLNIKMIMLYGHIIVIS